MDSSTGGDDNGGSLPLQGLRDDPAMRARALELLSSIAGSECIEIWLQGAVVFGAPNDGSIRVYGFQHKGGLHPWSEAFLAPIVAAVAGTQDNRPEGHELVALSDTPECAAIKAAKRENRIRGLHCASALRRWARAGIGRKAALSALASAYSVTASMIETLARLANQARWVRVQRLRENLVRRWERDGLGVAEMARRLNVSMQHARRVRAEAIFKISEEETGNASA